MNVTSIQSCHAASAARRWIGQARTRDRARYGDDNCDVRTSPAGEDAYCPSNIESPLQPPWRVLPYPTPSVAAVRRSVAVAAVKAPVGSADVSSVGRTLDLFV